MAKKQQFYDRYGVEEYYIYDPDRNDLNGFQRVDGALTVIDAIDDWVSPRLGIRFVVTVDTLAVYYPDGRQFLTTVELMERSVVLSARADRLAQRLRDLGVDPDMV
jgi:hypothetical protein